MPDVIIVMLNLVEIKMTGTFCVFRMGEGDGLAVDGIVAEGWSPMLLSEAEELGLYKDTPLSLSVEIESADDFQQRYSKFDLLLRHVHADELHAEFVRFLNVQYLGYHDVAMYMLNSGRWLVKDVKKLKMVPEHVFERFYDDCDEVFESHLALHKHELESFRRRAKELGVHLKVYSQDALMLRRLVSNVLKKARDLESFDVEAIREAVNASEKACVQAIDPALLFITLVQYSNYARRVERRYLAKKNKRLLLTDLFDRFIEERKLSIYKKSVKKYKTSFSAFVRLIGADVLLNEFFETHCNEPLAVRFKVALMRSGITDPRTVNGYLSNLRQFVKWAAAQCGISFDKNPFDGLNLKLSKNSGMVRRIFTNDEVQRILGYVPTNVREAKKFRDALYWVPKIMAYALMRPCEIVMLKPSNIKRRGQIVYIDLTDENGKTDAARRKIPIHKTLLAYGFLDFVKSAIKNNQTYLLAELHGSTEYSASALAEKIGKSINRTCLRKLGIVAEGGRKVDLYCVRKTGISRLKYEGACGYIVRQLVGHELDDDVTFGVYGAGVSTKLEALADVIHLLDYSDESIFEDSDEPIVFD